jgi:parvulin-like peptidyl-prolyl isomerase
LITALPTYTHITFRQLYFPFSSKDQAKTALTLLEVERDSSEASDLADHTLLPALYDERDLNEISQIFGSDFARTLVSLKPGTWCGPIESTYGWHLVWIDSRNPT